jgi:hypothetical protein
MRRVEVVTRTSWDCSNPVLKRMSHRWWDAAMPRRNTRDRRRARTIYHVYNRASDGQAMFRDDDDRRYFRDLIKRYLSTAEFTGARGRRFPSLRHKLRLVTFALMTTHFHLVLFQQIPGGIEDFMHRVLLSYVRYFNDRHGLAGPMFDVEYNADAKLTPRSELNAIAYVHDNHGDDCRCEFCGNRFYMEDPEQAPSWLGAAGGLRLFGGRQAYLRFRAARHAQRDVLSQR